MISDKNNLPALIFAAVNAKACFGEVLVNNVFIMQRAFDPSADDALGVVKAHR